jgi:hypothetical protein
MILLVDKNGKGSCGYFAKLQKFHYRIFFTPIFCWHNNTWHFLACTSKNIYRIKDKCNSNSIAKAKKLFPESVMPRYIMGEDKIIIRKY